MRMNPCPFCEGPPVMWVRRYGGKSFIKPKRYTNNGVFLKAHVWCHECGAHGPSPSDLVYCDSDVADLELKAAELWNQRDGRHRNCYDGSVEIGLCEHPRQPASEACADVSNGYERSPQSIEETWSQTLVPKIGERS
jgi:hypothetical protein